MSHSIFFYKKVYNKNNYNDWKWLVLDELKKVIIDLIGNDAVDSFLQQFPNYFANIKNNPYFSSIATGLIVNAIWKAFQNKNSDFKINDVILEEKIVHKKDVVASIPLRNYTSLPKGNHTFPYFAFSEIGNLQFTTNQNTKLKNVKLIYSIDDQLENTDNIENLTNILKFEKLKKKSKKNEKIFRSDCPLVFSSENKFRIKNFLVCVDAGKKGYDCFVIQTFQAALFEYFVSCKINSNLECENFGVIFPVEPLKNRFKMQHRIIRLNNLDSLVDDFIIDGNFYKTGIHTLHFKNFVKFFYDAYNFQKYE